MQKTREVGSCVTAFGEFKVLKTKRKKKSQLFIIRDRRRKGLAQWLAKWILRRRSRVRIDLLALFSSYELLAAYCPVIARFTS